MTTFIYEYIRYAHVHLVFLYYEVQIHDNKLSYILKGEMYQVQLAMIEFYIKRIEQRDARNHILRMDLLKKWSCLNPPLAN